MDEHLTFLIAFSGIFLVRFQPAVRIWALADYRMVSVSAEKGPLCPSKCQSSQPGQMDGILRILTPEIFPFSNKGQEQRGFQISRRIYFSENKFPHDWMRLSAFTYCVVISIAPKFNRSKATMGIQRRACFFNHPSFDNPLLTSPFLERKKYIGSNRTIIAFTQCF